MAAATGFHCARCGLKVDATGVTHTDNKGASFTVGHANMAVADNWPEVRKP